MVESSKNIITNKDGSPVPSAWWKTALEWMPYPIAIGIGYYAFDVEVKKSIYRNIAKHGYFNDLQKERNVPYEATLRRGSVNGESIAKELHAIEETYRENVHKTFREKFGMKGMLDYWQGIQRNQKISAIVMGATVTSIVLGAAFLIKENDKIQEMMSRKERERELER